MKRKRQSGKISGTLNFNVHFSMNNLFQWLVTSGFNFLFEGIQLGSLRSPVKVIFFLIACRIKGTEYTWWIFYLPLQGRQFLWLLFAFLHMKLFLKKGLLYKERICSQWEQILYRVDLIFRRGQKQFLPSFPLPTAHWRSLVCSFPLSHFCGLTNTFVCFCWWIVGGEWITEI